MPKGLRRLKKKKKKKKNQELPSFGIIHHFYWRFLEAAGPLKNFAILHPLYKKVAGLLLQNT